MNKCEKCGFLHYRTDPCRKPKVRIGIESSDNALTTPKSSVSAEPPSDVKVHTQSTAPRKDEARHGTSSTSRALTRTDDRKRASGEAGTQVLPVDTNPVQDAKAMTVNTAAAVATEPAQGVQIPRLGPLPKFDKKAWMRDYMREHRRGIRRRRMK